MTTTTIPTSPDRARRPSVGILGAGMMGAALVGGIVRGGHPASTIAVADIAVEPVQALQKQWGIRAASGVAEVATATEMVFVVVKPRDVLPLLAEIAPALGDDVVIVSLAAGVSTAAMLEVLPPGTSVIRAVPNTPAQVGEALSVISPCDTCTPAQLERVRAIMSLLGTVVVLPEPMQDVATAISGSGPAYGFYLAEAMVSSGVALGLSTDDARTLTGQTLVGAGRLLLESGTSPQELRRRVTSPNGTTAAAIDTFDEHHVMQALEEGIQRAAKRAVQLGLAAVTATS